MSGKEYLKTKVSTSMYDSELDELFKEMFSHVKPELIEHYTCVLTEKIIKAGFNANQIERRK